MPTAKKKLGGIGLFTRQADGNVSGPGASPRAVVGLPATPAPQFTRELPQLQPPPEIVTSRQDLPAALAIRSIPVPKGGRFVNSQSATGTMSLPPAPQHFHPMQRTRTTSSDIGREPPRSGQNAWEDSTVASMFGDNENRSASDRYRGHPALQGNHLRHYSDAAYQRAHQSPTAREHQPRPDDNMPFIIGENGLLKVVPHSAAQNRPGVAPLALAAKTDDIYLEDDHQALDATPTKSGALALRRTKLPHRDAREARRDSFSAGGYSSDAASLNISPDRPVDAVNQIERVRLEERVQERARRERERERELERDRDRERELHHKRSTVFENLTPIPLDEPTFDNTRAAVAAPTSSSNASPKSAAEAIQRTPRGPRGPLPSLPLTAKVGNINIPLALAETSIGRAGSRRLKEPTALQDKRKRPLSPDYNDAELHAMSYADLQAQAFDYDPQQAALRQQQQSAIVAPIGGTVEDRLEHYKAKGTLDQHQLFTSLSVEEWDEAGDWFLSRFSEIMAKIRKGRREKRQIVKKFEAEVATREEAVRGKMEGIARTLEDLKQEGQTMMEGKDMDLEF